MININHMIDKIPPAWKRAFIVIFLACVILLAPSFFLWAASGFEQDFFQIDSCLDSGGAWDKENRTCIGLNRPD